MLFFNKFYINLQSVARFSFLIYSFTDVYKIDSVKGFFNDNRFSVVIQHLSREGRFHCVKVFD